MLSSLLMNIYLQGPFLDWFIDTANDHPYLWALYAFALVLPFVICAAFCVRSKVGMDSADLALTPQPHIQCAGAA